MTLREMMKYIESEFDVINLTPCEICGGDYLTENVKIALIEDIPYDVCDCVCSLCGHEKSFKFSAPFIELEKSSKSKYILN